MAKCQCVKPLSDGCSLFRVPTLCDFEPLNQHVEVLHQLVQAAQSVDEMSQTITDLLNEQKVLCVRSLLNCLEMLDVAQL